MFVNMLIGILVSIIVLLVGALLYVHKRLKASFKLTVYGKDIPILRLLKSAAGSKKE